MLTVEEYGQLDLLNFELVLEVFLVMAMRAEKALSD